MWVFKWETEAPFKPWGNKSCDLHTPEPPHHLQLNRKPQKTRPLGPTLGSLWQRTPLLRQPQPSNFFLETHLCFLGIFLPVNLLGSANVSKTSFESKISPKSKTCSSWGGSKSLLFRSYCLQGAASVTCSEDKNQLRKIPLAQPQCLSSESCVARETGWQSRLHHNQTPAALVT